MSGYLVAVRHADGNRNLYDVTEVADYREAFHFIKSETKAPVVLVGIPGKKGRETAPLINLEQSA